MSFLNISRYLSIALISISVITPAHADDAMSRIRSSGVLHVATEPAYEPFEFMQGNKIVGYGPALLDQILEGTGIKLDRTTTSFSAALPGLLAKKYDMVATSLTITPERARKVAFTRPIAAIELAVLVRADEARIHSMDDLKGKRLGAQVNSNTLSRLAAFDKTLRDQGSQGLASLTQFTDNPELQLALAEKRIDAFLIPVSIARLWVKKQPGTFKVACTDTTSDKAYLAWAVRPDEKDLRDFINLRIKELKASGKLNELQMKWLGAIYETPETDYLPENL